MGLFSEAIVFGSGHSNYEQGTRSRMLTVKTPDKVQILKEGEKEDILYNTPYIDMNAEPDDAGMTPELQSKCDYLDRLLEQCDPADNERWDYLCCKILGFDDDPDDQRIINEYENKYGKENF